MFKLAHKYCQMACPKLGDGRSIMFRTGSWVAKLNGSSISLKFPTLFSFVIEGQQSVYDVLSQELLSTLHLPLSTNAFNELECLRQMMNGYACSEEHDSWIWPFNKGCSDLNLFMTMCTMILLSILFSNGFGNVHALLKLKCLDGCS